MKIHISLPSSALVEKFVAKTKFTQKFLKKTDIKDEFTNHIQKIIWKYKISESTVNISKTKEIEEIEVFEIELKQKKIPYKAIAQINIFIPYTILFVFTYLQEQTAGIFYTHKLKQRFYSLDWDSSDDEKNIPVRGENLQTVYENIVETFLDKRALKKEFFSDKVLLHHKIDEIEKEIQVLENKVRKEKQFNKKLPLNQELNLKKSSLKKLF